MFNYKSFVQNFFDLPSIEGFIIYMIISLILSNSEYTGKDI